MKPQQGDEHEQRRTQAAPRIHHQHNTRVVIIKLRFLRWGLQLTSFGRLGVDGLQEREAIGLVNNGFLKYMNPKNPKISLLEDDISLKII